MLSFRKEGGTAMTTNKKKPLSEYNLSPEKRETLLARIELVEQLFNPLFTDDELRGIKTRYRETTGCSERTIRNYLKRYKEKGIEGLVLHERKNERKPICSRELESAVVFLIRENPRRSMRKIREILLHSDEFCQEAGCVSERQFYRIAHDNGFDKRGRDILLDNVKRSFRSFEAPYSLSLVQGDARDGIWLERPEGKPRKTYLFAWVDDYSRKLLYAQYYWDEKLPRMEDSFLKMVLRYGLPEKLYLDNGSVYVSNHFLLVLRDLEIKKTHHPAYQAYCKGKVEAVMKKIKNDFQNEAQHAGFRTLEELNSAFFAWAAVKYDRQALSTTGEAPGERFVKGLTVAPRRIENLDEFMQYFLFRETRSVNKYGRIKMKGNIYPVKKASYGAVVHVRYDPFDLSKLFVYDKNGVLLETVEPVTLKNSYDQAIPEESKKPDGKVRESARNYFASLRKLHTEVRKKAMPNLEYDKLFKEDTNE